MNEWMNEMKCVSFWVWNYFYTQRITEMLVSEFVFIVVTGLLIQRFLFSFRSSQPQSSELHNLKASELHYSMGYTLFDDWYRVNYKNVFPYKKSIGKDIFYGPPDNKFDETHLWLTITALSVSNALNAFQLPYLQTRDNTIRTVQMLANGNCLALSCCNVHSY